MAAMRTRVTKAQAEAAFRAFTKKYEDYDLTNAVLVLEWDSGHPVIIWEEGPFEWAYGWENEKNGSRVFCEPYYSFVLGIYPA